MLTFTDLSACRLGIGKTHRGWQHLVLVIFAEQHERVETGVGRDAVDVESLGASARTGRHGMI